MRIHRVLVPLAPFAIVAACSTGGTGDPSSLAQGGIECHVTLQYGCCGLSPECVDRWSDAQSCAAWPAATPPTLYSTPCGGFVALSFASSTELRLYDATTGDLTAILESANGTDPVCNLGPPVLNVPATCITTWQAQGTPCLGLVLPAAPLVLCPEREDASADGASEDAASEASPAEASLAD